MQRLLLCLLMLVSGSVLAQPAQRPQNIDWIYLATNQANGYRVYRWKIFIVVDAGAQLGRFAVISPEIIAESVRTAPNPADKTTAYYTIVPAENIDELSYNLRFSKGFKINCETNIILEDENIFAKPFALNQATQLHQTAANLACVALDVNAEGNRDGTE